MWRFTVSSLMTALLMVWCSTAGAATYYVDADCGNVSTYVSSTGACTGGSEVVRTTIAGGVALLTPGDTLLIRGGTYAQQITTNESPGTIPTGTSAQPITIQAYPGETVTLRPSGTDSVLYLSLQNSPADTLAYLIFANLILDGDDLPVALDKNCIKLQAGVGHIIFRDIEAKNCPHHGVSVFVDSATHTVKSSFNQFIRVNIHDVGLVGRGYGYYIETDDNILDGGSIINASGGGMQLYSGSVSPSRNEVRGMLITNVGYCQSAQCPDLGSTRSGITLGNGNDNRVHHNLVYGNDNSASTGAWTFGIICSNRGTNGKVWNNTTYGNSVGFGNAGCGSSAIFRNNISYNNVISNYDTNGFPQAGTFSNNLCNSAISGICAAGNPQFINAGAGNFGLASGSAAIDAGTSSIASGITLMCNGNCDIGAFETWGLISGGMENAPPSQGCFTSNATRLNLWIGGRQGNLWA